MSDVKTIEQAPIEQTPQPIPEVVQKQYDHLVETIRAYNPGADFAQIDAAFRYAAAHHGAQKRKDGSPFVTHPLAVAQIVAEELHLDTESIVAALLHDTIEDTDATHEEISKLFSPTVADLVEGVSKLTRVHYTSKEEEQMENLRKMLMADIKNPDSSHDFGKDIIPTMLNDNRTLYAYKFEGYWKDVGTIDSLWEANMDLLSSKNELDLGDPSWKIYTEDVTALPQYISAEADVKDAYITQGCAVQGEVKHSVLFTGVKIGAGARIIDSVLMPGVVVEEGAVVQRALVADGVRIGKGAVVGAADSEHIELVAKRVKGAE